MSGTLVVDEKVSWLPAGWVYDGVLELVAQALDEHQAELRQFLTDAQTYRRGYCDIQALGIDQYNIVLEAAGRAYMKAANDGPGAFRDPKAYAPFIKHFGVLIEMLRADPRARVTHDRN
jgi:hypothetical protein